MVMPARPLSQARLAMKVLPVIVSPGTSEASRRPEPPVPGVVAFQLTELCATRLSVTPAVLCPATITPQPS